MLKDMFKITEPQWGFNFLVRLNNIVHQNEMLLRSIPLLADVFVFTYPIYLGALYIYGIYRKDIESKLSALYVFTSVFVSVIVNLGIQYMVDKQRPEQIALTQDNLIFEHVPTKPFPSDHAAVSAAIATATLIRGIKNNNKKYIYFGIVLWIFSVVMCAARISAGVHWPTDIIAGMLVGISVSGLLMISNIYVFIKIKLFLPLIRLEKAILKVFGVRQ